MERILTAEQMRRADEFTIKTLGVDEKTLIERAGTAVFDEIVKRFKGGRVLVCVGKGNNGEDGKIVAQKLAKIHGFYVSVLNFSLGALKFFDKKYDIIVDCLFGTGLNREITGVYKEVIDKINESKSYVISCDIPSGLSADTGKPLGVAVKANLTVSIQEYKLGHFINDGPDYCGTVVNKDIGISVWGDDFTLRLNSDDVAKYFPYRKRNVNKGNFGKVLIMGGSKDFSGSAFLSYNSLSALKTGRGYSYLCVPESLFSIYALKNPEIIIKTAKDNNGFFSFDEVFLNGILNMDSIAFGMGVGVSEEIYKIIEFLLKNYSGKLIIDADGLNTLAKFGKEILKDAKCQVVLTPHVGEFSRLTGLSKEYITDNFITVSENFAKEYGVTLLLKSATSVITDGERVFLNTTGCSGLSKGGSGDVLCGIVAGLIAESNDFTESVAAAAFLFGFTGEIAQKESSEFTLTASEVIDKLPAAIKNL